MIRKNKKKNYLVVFVIFINIITFLFPSNPIFALDSAGLDATASKTSVEPDASNIGTSATSTESNSSDAPDPGTSTEPNASDTSDSEITTEPNTSDTPDSEISTEPNTSDTPNSETSTDSDATDTTTSGDSVEPDTSTTTEPAVEVGVDELPPIELDTVAPVITLIGDAVENIAVYSNYTDPGVTVTDNQDTGLVATVTYTKNGILTNYINTYEEGTYIVHYNVSDTATNRADEVTRTVIVGSIEDEPISDKYNVDGYKTNLAFSLLSDEEVRTLLGVTDGTGDDEPGETTPSAVSVRINGNEKVGNTLSGELIMGNGNQITESSTINYKWYRLSSRDSENGTLVGSDETYKLVSDDGNKYIKLVVTYEGKTFEAITSKIAKTSSSSSGSNSSSNNNSNESSSSSQSSSSNSQTSTTNDNSTTAADGWKNNSSGWEYIENGQAVTGWKQINGSWYLMNSNGAMTTGWQQANGIWYYLKNDGAMATGWQQTNGTWYYLKNDGAMATGWQETNGTWYYLRNDGSMATGWQEMNGTWYYLKSDGAMATGWQEINGTWYYLKRDGAMATDQ